MNRIEFKKTNHIFLDNGIIALHRYLQKYADTEGVVVDLQPDKLVVESVDLPQLLETVYYEMGREIYDTYTLKQEQKAENLFYIEVEDRFDSFPRMKTYGFTELLTNDAQGTTTKKANSPKIEELEKENNELAEKFKAEYERRGLKIGKKVYLNERYTKLTRLEPLTNAHLETGNSFCYLTGEKVKKLVDSQNTSAFISGLVNFNSHVVIEDKKMSWKALYLSRFAAANCLYAYSNKIFESINVYFFGANTLTDLAKLYDSYLKEGVGIRLPREIWKIEMEFIRNFQLYNFGKEKVADGFIGKNEYLFMVLYTLFERIIRHLEPQKELLEYADLLGDALDESDFNTLNPVIVSLRTDAFASTKRPNSFEVFTQLRYVMQLFRFFETEKIDVLEILWSLKTIKPSLRSNRNSYQLERQSRDRILGLLLRGQSILVEIEQIFYDSFRYLAGGDTAGYKNYGQLVELIKLYESKINKKMDENLQSRAIKLGSSIGQGILSYGEGQRMTNAKQGRSYIIALRKSRTLIQFLEALTTIQTRYSLIISRELIDGIDEQSFELVKQFAIIGALNQLNIQLNSSSKKES